MSKNNTTEINEQIEIPKLRLWLIWLFLFVLPSLATVNGFKYYSKEYSYFTDTDLIASAFEIIRRYNHSIIPENFMEDQIKKLKKLNLNISHEEMKKEIDKTLCGETLFCIFFDEKLEKLTTVKSPTLNIIKNIPSNYIKLNLKKIVNTDKTKDKNISERVLKFNEAQSQLGIAFQQMFKTITSITFSSNKVAKNYSVINGGELYFILCEFDKPINNNGGFLAVMRGREFSFHKMLEKLHVDYPNIRIIFKEIDINKASQNPEKFYSGIKKGKKGLYIIEPTSSVFARHVLHGGTEKLIEGYKHLFPMIEYHIPIDEYQQRLNKIETYLKFIALFIIFLSAIFFLHVSLFGLNENLSFKSKIVSLIIISSLFPFSVFTLGIYAINKYNHYMKLISIQQHVETEFQLINMELEQYLIALETKTALINKDLSKMINNSDLKSSEFSDYVKSIGDKLPISSELIYLTSVPKNLKPVFPNNKILIKFPDKLSKELMEEEKDVVSSIIPSALLQKANEVEKENPSFRKRKNVHELGNFETIDITEINDWLVDSGKINTIKKYNIPIFFIFNYLYSTNSDDIVGVFITKYEPKGILSSFYSERSLSKNDIRKSFREEKDNYIINYVFLPTKDSGNAVIWEKSGNISQEDKELILKIPQSEIMTYGNKLIIKKKHQKIPHLLVAIITENNNYGESTFILIVLVCVLSYLSLILYFANNLLDIMFVEPVMILASNANAIARGGDTWNAEIKSGDEFEDLNNDFKKLVVGLKERNILKSYVSEDALSDIEETESLKLLPGGEYLNATIVFSAIKDYENIIRSMTPEENIKLLSSYISIGEECAKNHSGSLDKILGDTIMLVFRENELKESHGLRAAKAALELVEKSKSIGLPGLYTGIASGRVISGKIGSYYGKLDFTVIGNPVNLAARFKAEAKKGSENTGIIISGETIGLLKGKGKIKFLRRCSIKGKSREYNIYELLSLRS
jgi:class 3 adenylate cyclase